VNGAKTKEIFDFFSTSTNETVVVLADDNAPQEIHQDLNSSDLLALLFKLQADVVDIKKKQASDSVILESVKSDVTQISTLFRTMYGTVNSILSRVGSLTETINETQQLKSDMTKMDSSIRTLNQRLVNSNANCANKDPI